MSSVFLNGLKSIFPFFFFKSRAGGMTLLEGKADDVIHLDCHPNGASWIPDHILYVLGG